MFLITKEERNTIQRERYKNDSKYREQEIARIRERRKNDPKYNSIEYKESEKKRKLLEEKMVKIKCLTYYSNKDVPVCNCCNENNIDKLTIDHINGGGRKHIKEVGNKIYRWTKKNNFPQGYQVLCFNCNLGKHNKSLCPHKLSQEEINKILCNRHYKERRLPILKKFSKNGVIECVSCHEKSIFHLAVDHINGGGAKHRASFKDYSKYLIWLRDEAPKEDYQILCHNCNHLKRIGKLN